MPSQRLTPQELNRARTLVSRVPGISSCHISTDGDGEVTEIHVVSAGQKSPKLVARDVESLLKAELGLAVDYRKIGVVTIEAEELAEAGSQPPPAVPAAEPDASPGTGVAEFPVEEYPSRFVFQSVNVFASKGEVKAEVELMRDSVESFGSYMGANTPAPPWRVVAEATLLAISEFLDEAKRLCLGEVQKVAVADESAFLVTVDMIDERNTKTLAGCSIVAGNENQSVVYATLDAVNRVVGKLEFKSSIEYKIR